MKGFKLLFFLVFPLVLSGQVEFAPISAEWHYSVNIPGYSPCNYYTFQQAELRCYRDSSINWKRIEMDCDTWLMASDVEEPPIPGIRLWPQPASRRLMVEGWEKIKRGRY